MTNEYGDKNRFVELFGALGEDIFSAKTYLKVLCGEANTIQELQKGLDCDHDIIMGALERLVSIPLLSTHLNRDHQIIYYALPPQQAFDAIATSIRWEMDESLHEELDIGTFDPELGERLENFHLIIDELGNLAAKWFRFNTSVSVEMVKVSTSWTQSASVLVDGISKASSEIVGVAFHPHLFGIIAWEAIVERMAKGVKYERISVVDEVVRHGVKIFTREAKELGVGLSFIEPERISQKFYVIDENQVVFYNPGKKMGEFELSGQSIQNQGLAKVYKETYKKLKSQAISSDIIIPNVLASKTILLEYAKKVLDTEQLYWFEKIVDYGKFARFPEFTDEIIGKIEEVAWRHKLIRRTDEGIVANLQIDLPKIRTLSAQH